jgi:hypothetical protein
MRAPSIASANATTTTTKVIDNQELFTITQVNEKRIRFNERIGLESKPSMPAFPAATALVPIK